MLLKLAILISGRGSNMKSILSAVQKQNIPIKPTIVISNRRVVSSIDCAAATNHIKVNPAGWLTTANQLPRGISIRYLEPPVVSSEVYDPTDDWGEEF